MDKLWMVEYIQRIVHEDAKRHSSAETSYIFSTPTLFRYMLSI